MRTPEERLDHPIEELLGNSKLDATIPSLYTSLPGASRQETAFGRLLQCRTGHSYSGEYYRRFVPSADPACPRRENTLSNPPTCEKHRTAIRRVSQMLYLPDLPGTMA